MRSENLRKKLEDWELTISENNNENNQVCEKVVRKKVKKAIQEK